MIKILYVDDELLNLLSFEMLFRDNYDVKTAPNAKEGWNIFNNENINIIVSDQKMPGETGVAFLEKIASTNSKTLRIIHSGLSEKDEDISRAIKNNTVNAFLDKPLNENRLISIIDSYIASNI